MNKTVQLIHDEIIKKPFVLTNRKILKNLVNECALIVDPDIEDSIAKAKRLVSALQCGALSIILSEHSRAQDFSESIYDKIQNYTGYDNKTVGWIVSTWMTCVDDKVIGSWNAYNDVLTGESNEDTLIKKPNSHVCVECTKVAGVTFEGRQALINQLLEYDALTKGQELLLDSEPDNPYDSNAIAVLHPLNAKLGYINKELAKRLSEQVKLGDRFRATVLEVTGSKLYGMHHGININIIKE